MSLDWNSYTPPRVRSSYRAWRRFRRARRLVSTAGVIAVLALALMRVLAHLQAGEPITTPFIVLIGAGILTALLMPRLIANLVWDLTWRRRWQDGD